MESIITGSLSVEGPLVLRIVIECVLFALLILVSIIYDKRKAARLERLLNFQEDSQYLEESRSSGISLNEQSQLHEALISGAPQSNLSDSMFYVKASASKASKLSESDGV